MSVLEQFSAETFIASKGKGSDFTCPMGVHGLYLLDDPQLKRACPEIELISQGVRWKNYNQDFGNAPP
jgi:hypothetical protein